MTESDEPIAPTSEQARDCLGGPRYGRYLTAAGGDPARNAYDAVLSESFPDWATTEADQLFGQEDGPAKDRNRQRELDDHSLRRLADARRGLASRPSHGQVFAALDFGFWSQLTRTERTRILPRSTHRGWQRCRLGYPVRLRGYWFCRRASGSVPEMSESEAAWSAVDKYFIQSLVDEDEGLAAARASSAQTVMPLADVAPNQGAFLSLMAQIAGARRVLEFGTLAGYSTIWLARAVGPSGTVVTLEVDEVTAAVARENFERAGVASTVELIVGPALESVHELVRSQSEPFDLIFIDADKPSNPQYLESALRLSRVGTVIIGDNVVRNGAVVDASGDDPRVQETRSMIEMLGADDRVTATALQTVGMKGWDGFVVARVRRM